MNKYSKYFKNSNIIIGIIFILIIFTLMTVGFFYTPYEFDDINVDNKLHFFSAEHILGTDDLGRDILSRLMLASRVSFFIGTTVSVIGLLIGGFLGSLAGYFGGITDEIIMKLIDVQMAFPGILIALMMIAVFGGGTANIVMALSIMSVPKFARIVRSGFIKYKNFDFVKAEKARGASHLRIMFIHIFPNIMPEIIVTVSLSFASAVMSEAGLSYLGLGGNPTFPSFGKMLSEAQGVIFKAPWYVFIPTIAVTLILMGFNFIADGIRQIQKEEKNRI